MWEGVYNLELYLGLYGGGGVCLFVLRIIRLGSSELFFFVALGVDFGLRVFGGRRGILFC